MGALRTTEKPDVRPRAQPFRRRRTASTLPAAGSTSRAAIGSYRMRTRIRGGLRRRDQWLQLVKFCAVGASGYVVNICIFAVIVRLTNSHHLVAAAAAFLGAVTHNFWCNRRWTFSASSARAQIQGPRFFVVSVGAFVMAGAMLELFVSVGGLPEVISQAISIVVATPFNFMGNKLWAFHDHS
jgi:putative flippase GtrA